CIVAILQGQFVAQAFLPGLCFPERQHRLESLCYMLIMRQAVLWLFLVVAAPVFAGAAGTLRVRIFDAGHKSMVAARVNVIGSDNAFYEPDPSRNPLAEYSL